MTAKIFNPLELWSSPATEAFEFWASLWPTAPLFGIKWRYADTVDLWTPLMGVSAGVKPVAPKAAKPEPVVIEAVPAAEVVPAAAFEVASAAAETDEPAVPASLLVNAPANADDLTVIKGVGPALARQLNGLGVYRISQIAAFSDEDLAWIDLNLSAPRGRCFRDDWTGQAKALLA